MIRVYLTIAVAALAFAVHLALSPPPIPVLLLHDVKTDRIGYDFWTLHPDRFREMLDVIDRAGYHGITLEEAARHLQGRLGLDRSARAVLITVDDGFGSASRLVGPELARRGHPAAFFIVGGWKPPEYVGDDDLRALARAGHSIGSHSMTHSSLNVRGKNVSAEEARITSELTSSRARLQEVVGTPVIGLAYPKGDWDATTKRLARGAGYQLAFTTDQGYLEPGADNMELPRYQLNFDTPMPWIENYVLAPRRERERNELLAICIAALGMLGAFTVHRRGGKQAAPTDPHAKPME